MTPATVVVFISYSTRGLCLKVQLNFYAKFGEMRHASSNKKSIVISLIAIS